MKSLAPEHRPQGRWLLPRILLAELGDLETDEVVRQGREGLRRLQGAELSAEEFQSLLDAERARLGGLAAGESGSGWPTPIALALSGMIEEPIGSWDRLAHRLRDAFEILVKYLAAMAICDVLERAASPQSLRSILVKG